MKGRLWILVVCLFNVWIVLADSLCDQSSQRGVDFFYQGKYAEAKKCFVYANNRCPDAKTAEWIKKCDEALKPKPQIQSQTQVQQNSNIPQHSKKQASTPNKSTNSKNTNYSQTNTSRYTLGTIKVSESYLTFKDVGGDHAITISCNEEWGFTYAYKDAAHQYKSTDFIIAKDRNTLTISCYKNPFSHTRYAQFDVFLRSNKNVKRTIYLTQAAGASITASIGSQQLSSEGGQLKIQVTSNCLSGWYVKQHPYWFTFISKTRDGITFNYYKNRLRYNREGYVTFSTADEKSSYTLKIVQPEYVSPSSWYFLFNGKMEWVWFRAGGSIGYPYNVDLDVLSLRLWWFEFTPASFGLRGDYDTYNFYWRPTIRGYIPVNNRQSITVAMAPICNFRPKTEYTAPPMSQLNNHWWFMAEVGYHCNWKKLWGTDFFIRYDGGFSAGAKFDIHSSYIKEKL